MKKKAKVFLKLPLEIELPEQSSAPIKVNITKADECLKIQIPKGVLPMLGLWVKKENSNTLSYQSLSPTELTEGVESDLITFINSNELEGTLIIQY